MSREHGAAGDDRADGRDLRDVRAAVVEGHPDRDEVAPRVARFLHEGGAQPPPEWLPVLGDQSVFGRRAVLPRLLHYDLVELPQQQEAGEDQKRHLGRRVGVQRAQQHERAVARVQDGGRGDDGEKEDVDRHHEDAEQVDPLAEGVPLVVEQLEPTWKSAHRPQSTSPKVCEVSLAQSARRDGTGSRS